MVIQPAEPGEIPLLTDISRRAFDTDVLVGAPGPGGPPDYDSAPWHQRMRLGGHLYTIRLEGQPIGGVILFRDRKDPKNMFLGRIFLEPALHRQGLGLTAMKVLEETFPEVTVWALDTPVWNTRTIPFYRKAGYLERGRDEEGVYFQKIIR